MNKNTILFVALISAFLLGACSTQTAEPIATPQVPEGSFSDFDYECTAQQLSAQACTLEYMPVCGNDGLTYGNGCAACATAGVYAYNYGACE